MAGIFRVNHLYVPDFIGSAYRHESITPNIPELGISTGIPLTEYRLDVVSTRYFAFTTVPSFSSWAKESGALAGMDLNQPRGVFAQMTSANLLPAIQSRQLSLDNINDKVRRTPKARPMSICARKAFIPLVSLKNPRTLLGRNSRCAGTLKRP